MNPHAAIALPSLVWRNVVTILGAHSLWGGGVASSRIISIKKKKKKGKRERKWGTQREIHLSVVGAEFQGNAPASEQTDAVSAQLHFYIIINIIVCEITHDYTHAH